MLSKPASTARAAARAKSPVIRSMSSSVAARTIDPSGVTVRDGASAGARFDFGLATGPAWPIWAATAAPVRWTASVSRASPSTVSGRSCRHRRSVRPSGDTARYATVVIPTPPSATRRW